MGAVQNAFQPKAGTLRKRRDWWTRSSGLLAGLLALLVAYPLVRVVVRLFWADEGPTLEPLRATLALPDLGLTLATTLGVVGGSALIGLVIGGGFAWLNERTDARLGVVTDLLPLVPFLLPPVAGAVGWVLLFSPRGGVANGFLRDFLGFFGINLVEGPLNAYSWYGILLAYSIYQVPYAYLMISSGLRNLDPSLEQQARLSGASDFTVARTVTLPAIAPSVGASVLLMVWSGFALFSLPQILGSPTDADILAVRIVQLLSFSYPPQTDAAVGLSFIMVAIVGGVYLLQRRVLSRGRHATASGKGVRAQRLTLSRRGRRLARSGMVIYLVLSTGLPITGLLLVSFQGYWSPDIDWSNMSLAAWQSAVLDNSATRRALINSLQLGVAGATLGTLLAAIVAVLVARRPTRPVLLADASVKLPSAVSGLVLAVGIVFAFAGPPFRLGGTLTILLIAYLVLYMPQASIAADAAAGQIGNELSEASAVSGIGNGSAFWRIYLPLMLPGLLAGWALLFVRVFGDLAASAILAGSRNPVIGFRVMEAFSNGSYATLSAIAATIVVVSCIVVALSTALARYVGRRQSSTAKKK